MVRVNEEERESDSDILRKIIIDGKDPHSINLLEEAIRTREAGNSGDLLDSTCYICEEDFVGYRGVRVCKKCIDYYLNYR